MQWFKHMSDMSVDVKIKRVIKQYGIEGYGLYCLIVERIVRNLTTETPMPDLEETSADLAHEFGIDTIKCEEIMLFCINQGLFEQDEMTGKILCGKVYKFLQASQTKSERLRKMIKGYKGKGGNRQSETVIDFCEEENRIEKNRIEHNIKESPIDSLINHWNKKENIPKYRYTSFNIPNGSEILSHFDAYSLDELKETIDNYDTVHGHCYSVFDGMANLSFNKFFHTTWEHFRPGDYVDSKYNKRKKEVENFVTDESLKQYVEYEPMKT